MISREVRVQLQLADDVAQGGGREVLDGGHGLHHPIGIELGVGDEEIDHRVDLHGDVILGDDGLGREVGDALLERHLVGHPLDEGDLEMDAGLPGALVGAQALDDKGAGLGDHHHVGDHQHHYQQNEHGHQAEGKGRSDGKQEHDISSLYDHSVVDG